MARKKTDSIKDDLSRQVNFRITEEFHARIEKTARGLGLDVANFLRLVITRNLDQYEREVEELSKRRA